MDRWRPPYGVYVSSAGLRLCGDAFGILTVHRAEHAAMRDAPGCDDSALGRDTGSPSAAKVDIANDRFSQAVAGAGVELQGELCRHRGTMGFWRVCVPAQGRRGLAVRVSFERHKG